MCLNTVCADKEFARAVAIARVAILATLTIAASIGAVDAAETDGPVVVANNNTDPAGVNADRTVSIRLRAAKGRWQPEGPEGPTLTVDAFGEEGKPLMVPSP